MTEPVDVTSRILIEIRDELRAQRDEFRAQRGELSGIRERLHAQHDDVVGIRSELGSHNARFEVIETVLRDVAEQVVMMGRGLKVAIESRRRDDARLDDHEARLRRLETQVENA